MEQASKVSFTPTAGIREERPKSRVDAETEVYAVLSRKNISWGSGLCLPLLSQVGGDGCVSREYVSVFIEGSRIAVRSCV